MKQLFSILIVLVLITNITCAITPSTTSSTSLNINPTSCQIKTAAKSDTFSCPCSGGSGNYYWSFSEIPQGWTINNNLLIAPRGTINNNLLYGVKVQVRDKKTSQLLEKTLFFYLQNGKIKNIVDYPFNFKANMLVPSAGNFMAAGVSTILSSITKILLPPLAQLAGVKNTNITLVRNLFSSVNGIGGGCGLVTLRPYFLANKGIYTNDSSNPYLTKLPTTTQLATVLSTGNSTSITNVLVNVVRSKVHCKNVVIFLNNFLKQIRNKILQLDNQINSTNLLINNISNQIKSLDNQLGPTQLTQSNSTSDSSTSQTPTDPSTDPLTDPSTDPSTSDQLSTLQDTLSQNKNTKKNLQQKLSQLTNNITSNQNQLSSLMNQQKQYQQNDLNYNNQIDNYTQQISTLQSQIDNLNTLLKDVENNKSNNNDHLNNVSNQINNINDQTNSTNDEITQTNAQIEDAKNAITQTQKKIASIQQSPQSNPSSDSTPSSNSDPSDPSNPSNPADPSDPSANQTKILQLQQQLASAKKTLDKSQTSYNDLSQNYNSFTSIANSNLNGCYGTIYNDKTILFSEDNNGRIQFRGKNHLINYISKMFGKVASTLNSADFIIGAAMKGNININRSGIIVNAGLNGYAGVVPNTGANSAKGNVRGNVNSVTGTGTSKGSTKSKGTETSTSTDTSTGTSASTGTGTSASAGAGKGTSASTGTGVGKGTSTGAGTATGTGTGTGTGSSKGSGVISSNTGINGAALDSDPNQVFTITQTTIFSGPWMTVYGNPLNQAFKANDFIVNVPGSTGQNSFRGTIKSIKGSTCQAIDDKKIPYTLYLSGGSIISSVNKALPQIGDTIYWEGTIKPGGQSTDYNVDQCLCF